MSLPRRGPLHVHTAKAQGTTGFFRNGTRGAGRKGPQKRRAGGGGGARAAEFPRHGPGEAWGQGRGLLGGAVGVCLRDTWSHRVETVTTAGTAEDLNHYKISNAITELEALGLGAPDAVEGFSKGLKMSFN